MLDEHPHARGREAAIDVERSMSFQAVLALRPWVGVGDGVTGVARFVR